jgi:hypothetical protein
MDPILRQHDNLPTFVVRPDSTVNRRVLCFLFTLFTNQPFSAVFFDLKSPVYLPHFLIYLAKIVIQMHKLGNFPFPMGYLRSLVWLILAVTR